MDKDCSTSTVIFVCGIEDKGPQRTSQTGAQGSQKTMNQSTPTRKNNQSQIKNSSLSLGVLFLTTLAQRCCSTDLTAALHDSNFNPSPWLSGTLYQMCAAGHSICGFPVYVTNRNLDNEEWPLNLMPRLLCIARNPDVWVLYIGRREASSRCGKKKVERFLTTWKISCHMTNYVLKNIIPSLRVSSTLPLL